MSMFNIYVIILISYCAVSYFLYYLTKLISIFIKNKDIRSYIGALEESIDTTLSLILVDVLIYSVEIIKSLPYNIYNICAVFVISFILYFSSKRLKIENILFEPLNLKIFNLYGLIMILDETVKLLLVPID